MHLEAPLMGHEIERKFRVDPGWQPEGDGVLFEQGYLSSHPERTVRVRTEGTIARLTVKGPTVGVTRVEYEYPIPLDDARVMLAAEQIRAGKVDAVGWSRCRTGLRTAAVRGHTLARVMAGLHRQVNLPKLAHRRHQRANNTRPASDDQ